MNLSKEMLAALEADGEKLRQLTGEDHGPWTHDQIDGEMIAGGNVDEDPMFAEVYSKPDAHVEEMIKALCDGRDLYMFERRMIASELKRLLKTLSTGRKGNGDDKSNDTKPADNWWD